MLGDALLKREEPVVCLPSLFVSEPHPHEQRGEVGIVSRLHALALRGHGAILVGIGKHELRPVDVDHVVGAVLLVGKGFDVGKRGGVEVGVARQQGRELIEAGDRPDTLDQRQDRFHAPPVARLHIQLGVIEGLRQPSFMTGERRVVEQSLNLVLHLAHALPKSALAAVAGPDLGCCQPVPVDCGMKIVLKPEAAVICDHPHDVNVGPRSAVQRLVLLVLLHAASFQGSCYLGYQR